ncbi:hypothetical protein ACHWQZ_G008907 [Mnemiopsis leidyi]
MSWRIRHNITNTAMDELLKFVSIANGQSEGPLASFYKFENYVKSLCDPEHMDLFVFCPNCRKTYDKAYTGPCGCGTIICSTSLMKSGHTFMYSPVERSLKFLLRQNFVAILQYIAKDQSAGVLTDVLDSKRYEELECIPYPSFTEGSCIRRVTLQINIDGLEVSKSSNSSLYPVMIVINELPPYLRQRNMVVPFLFRKSGDVDFTDSLLKNLVQELNSLFLKGVSWEDLNGSSHCTQVVPFCICTDSMMKFKLLGIKSPSGYSSCPNCLESGAYLYKGKAGSLCFPPRVDMESQLVMAEPRTIANAEAGQNGQVFSPLLASLNSIGDKLFECMAIDQLHSVFEGNLKALTKMIFFSKDVPAQMRRQRLDLARKFMERIKPPHFMERGIRPLEDYKHWKAHEWRAYFFYMLLPLLHALVCNGAMKLKQAQHLEQYIVAISLLNGDRILLTDVEVAKGLLVQFVKNLDTFYPIGAWTHNMHLTLHLADMVQYLGPLWGVSMFIFEGYNRTVLQSFNGSRYVLQQVGSRLSLRRALYTLHDQIETHRPLSISLDYGICQSRNINGAIHGSLGITSANSEDKLLVARWYNTPAIGVNSLNLQSCSALKVGCQKFGTRKYYVDRGLKHQNCYVYNSIRRQYGEVKHIITDIDRGNIFLTYYVVDADGAHSSPSPPIEYGFVGAETYCDLECDLINNFTVCISVPMDFLGSGKMFIAHRINTFEGS